MHAMHEVPVWVKYAATIVMLIGLAIAWNNYIRRPEAAASFVTQFPGIYALREEQMVLRRAVRLPVRSAVAVARPAVLEGR